MTIQTKIASGKFSAFWDCLILKGEFFLFMYDIQHLFIGRPSDSTVSEDAGIEPRTVVSSELAVSRSNHSGCINAVYAGSRIYRWVKNIVQSCSQPDYLRTRRISLS